MTTGIVYFKFKHQNAFDKIEFSGSEITAAELRIKIQEKLLMVDTSYKNATTLQISKLGGTTPGGELVEFDHELIPSHASVLITRAPAKSTGAKNIVVESAQLFAQPVEGQEDYLALKPSIIQSELEAAKPVPAVTVCELCKWFMQRDSGHFPVVLSCCGNTICSSCAISAKSTGMCPLEKRDVTVQFVTNRAVERLVKVVADHRQNFLFDAVNVSEEFLVLPAPSATEAVTDIEVVDVDEFEPEVFDVDNPRPLTQKEREQLERRDRRKRKAMEILLKREGKVVKGELSEADVNRLLKTELKAELGFEAGTADAQRDEAADARRQIVIEFPRLLTREEFARWKAQV